MPNARDSHSAVAISRAACGSLLFHIVLGEFGDLVGERLELGAIGSVTSRAMRMASSFSFAIFAAASAPPAAAIASARTATIC